MSSIAFDAWISSFLKRIAYKEPKHAIRLQRSVFVAPVAAETKRKVRVNMHSALACECDNWLRWTNN